MAYKPEFYQIPSAVADVVQPHEAFVYAVIYWMYSMRDGRCWASNKTLAEALPYKSSEQSVSNAVSVLVKEGLVECVYKDTNKRNRQEIIPLVRYGRITHKCNAINPQVYRDKPTGVQIENNYVENKVGVAKATHSSHEETEDFVFETDEELLPTRQKVSRPRKDPLIDHFTLLSIKNIGSAPAIPRVAALTLLKSARQHLNDAQIKDMFEEWFGLGKPDNETIQITRALSTVRINQYKVMNGIK